MISTKLWDYLSVLNQKLVNQHDFSVAIANAMPIYIVAIEVDHRLKSNDYVQINSKCQHIKSRQLHRIPGKLKGVSPLQGVVVVL